jgi:DNA mismatch repair ATPase MutS
MMIPSVAQATIITGCTFDEAVYLQGDSGNITVTIYNDGDTKIRVTVLTADINYFYTNGDVYMQTFYTDEILPYEIQQGQSDNLVIPFSLHSDIASGYIEVFVKAITEQWNNNSQIWFSSDHPNYRPTLYVESSYKQLYVDEQAANDLLQSQVEDEQAANDLLQYQKQELEAVNTAVTNIMYILLMTTGAFVVVTIVLLILNRKARPIPRPTA